MSLRLAIPMLVVAAIGCGRDTTRIDLSIETDPAWSIDRFEIHVDDHTAYTALRSVTLAIDDERSALPMTIEVWGLAGERQVAYGRADVSPLRRGAVRGTVALAAVSCTARCDTGALQCDGDGVERCEQADDGCRRWSEPTACPADAPYCSNGECGTTCVDECEPNVSTCDGEVAVRACGSADQDPCHDWLAPQACPAGEACTDGACAPAACEIAGCPAPGPAVCADATTLRRWVAPAACVEGRCEYPSVDRTCLRGCDQGACRTGRADLILSNNVNVWVGLSTGSGFAPGTQWATAGRPLGFADVDGDGRADMVHKISGGAITVALSTGTSFAAATTWGTMPGIRSLADIDGDGREDAVGILGDTVEVAASTGSGLAPAMPFGTLPTTFNGSLADFDGDGRADLVGTSSDGTVWVFRSLGTTFATPLNLGAIMPRPSRYADVDGDGKADALHQESNKLWVGRSTGSGFEPLVQWTADTAMNVLADCDGDGKTDAVWTGNGQIAVSRSTGSGFEPAQVWTTYQGSLAFFADVDGQ